mgnify:CR=1 FL=1
MLKIGQYNTLAVTRLVDFGAYLDGGNGVEILLPAKYISEPPSVGDELEVFVYTDSEDRLIATTETPFVQVGEFAFLEVVSVSHVGAFLDWGLLKDLLVPFREQKTRMVTGRRYPVYVYLDDASKRVAASAKVEKFLGNVMPRYNHGDKVKALVYKSTPLGWACAVDNLHHGMIYANEIYTTLAVGDTIDAYVKNQRADGKLDLSLSGAVRDRISALAGRITDSLRAAGGRLDVGDKSSPEYISSLFGCSKKDFKKAVGLLLKESRIDKNTDRLTLLPSEMAEV